MSETSPLVLDSGLKGGRLKLLAKPHVHRLLKRANFFVASYPRRQARHSTILNGNSEVNPSNR